MSCDEFESSRVGVLYLSVNIPESCGDVISHHVETTLSHLNYLLLTRMVTIRSTDHEVPQSATTGRSWTTKIANIIKQLR